MLKQKEEIKEEIFDDYELQVDMEERKQKHLESLTQKIKKVRKN